MISTPLSLDAHRGEDGQFILSVEGEIDLSNVDEFEQAVAAATNVVDPAELLLVDLGAVDYLDSAAINALFAHASSIRVRLQPLLREVIAISGLADVIPVETITPEG